LTQTNVHCLAASGNRIYAGSWTGGLAYSSDQGLNWTAADSGLPSAPIKSLIWGPSGLVAGTHQGTYLSQDSGRTWSAAKTGLVNLQVSGLLRSGNRLLVATGTGVYRSDDSAASWTGPGAGLSGVVWGLAQHSGRIFAATGTGVFVSEDQGNAWQRLGQTWEGGGVDAMAVLGDTLLAGTRNRGIWRFDLSNPTFVRSPRARPNRSSTAASFAKEMKGTPGFITEKGLLRDAEGAGCPSDA
jgi:ligand-binding sensor domain-containing protein